MAGFTRTRVTGTASQDTFSSYSTDDFGPQVGRNSRTKMDMQGINTVIGRGETDMDIEYLALPNENGDLTYAYPNAAQNGWIVTPTRP